VKLQTLAGFDPMTLKPLSPHDMLRQAIRREQIRERMAAKAAESHVDERRPALTELRAVAYEVAVVAPWAMAATVIYLFWLLP
jgi:hypothetical protein